MTSRGLRIGSLGTLRHFDELRSHEFRLDARLAVFQKHFDDLAKVRIQLVECRRLRVRTWETGDGADEEAGLLAALNYSGVGLLHLPPDTTTPDKSLCPAPNADRHDVS